MRSFFSKIKNLYHLLLAFASALRYGFPSRKLIVVGVTGTNGKTTTVALLHEIFSATGAGVGSASSLRFKIKGEERKNELKMTMPGRGQLQKFLADCVKEKCTYVILEVTSEGIRQSRHRFINFDAAVITNLTPEHIESHGSFEEYRAMKQKLFEAAARARRKTFFGRKIQKIIAVNLDDPEYVHFLAKGADRYIGYTLEDRKDSSLDRTLDARDVSVGHEGVSFVIQGQKIASSLSGIFNASNMLAALSIATEYGASQNAIESAFAMVSGVPGRLERIREGQDFEVVVDYAHTPDALEKVYEAVQQLSKRRICVLGAAGGGRDKWKRSEFGAIAGRHCSDIILTDEDPYDENPKEILKEIKKGIPATHDVKMILDRREAVTEAIRGARAGDTVIITGKGAEPWMMGPKGQKIPWDDRAIAREAILRFLAEKGL
jgi:UDP-N-acetylmuramoyl-L-alanyl-D-glutamate--2,6-diaminopimelate ligase